MCYFIPLITHALELVYLYLVIFSSSALFYSGSFMDRPYMKSTFIHSVIYFQRFGDKNFCDSIVS
jgi:hypothetical protein